MSLAPFAAHEQRVNRAVLGRLANAVAVVQGGEPFGVLFQQPYSDAFGGQIDSASPACEGPAEQLGALQRDDAITINGTAYRVTTAEPDGTGMVRLVLYTDSGG